MNSVFAKNCEVFDNIVKTVEPDYCEKTLLSICIYDTYLISLNQEPVFHARYLNPSQKALVSHFIKRKNVGDLLDLIKATKASNQKTISAMLKDILAYKIVSEIKI